MNVESELKNIESRLNNILDRQLDIIQNDINKNLNKEDAEYLRKESTLTNHERGSTEYPLDTGSTQTYIKISNKAIEKITEGLKSIKESLNKIVDEYNSYEATNHSNTFAKFHNSVFSVLDEINYMLYDARNKKEPIFILKCKNINNKNSVSEKDIACISSELDEFKEKIQYVFKQISNISVPDDDIIKKEIEESRANMMQREMEEFSEYFEK